MPHDPSHVQLYRRVKNGSKDAHLQTLNRKEKLFSKPTLLCCGGININAYHQNQDGQPDYEQGTSGFAKIGHSLLGVRPYIKGDEPYDIVSVSYPRSTDELDAMLRVYNKSVQMTGKEGGNYTDFAKDFAKDQLFPLVEKEGKKLPLKDAKRNLRNVNVLAHSYGAAFIQQAGNALYEHMKELGYSNSAIQDATSQVLIVSAGTPVAPDSGRASFTTVDVMNYDDIEMQNHYPTNNRLSRIMRKPLLEMNRIDTATSMPSEPLTVVPVDFKSEAFNAVLTRNPDSNHVVVYASQPLIRNEVGKITREPAIPKMPRINCHKKIDPDYNDPTGHQVKTYFHYGLGRHGTMLRTAISSTLANGLYNAIDNRDSKKFTPLPETQALLQSPGEVRYKHEGAQDFVKIGLGVGYNERIHQASEPGPFTSR